MTDQPPYPPAPGSPAGFPPPAQPPASTPKKRRKWPWVAGGIVLLLVIIGVATDGGTQPTGAPAGNDPASAAGAPAGNPTSAPAQQQPAAEAEHHTVVYKVNGSGKAGLISYTTDGMTSSNQETNVKLPWTKTITLPTDQALQLVQVMAQGSSESSKVDVEIDVDGKVVKTAQATGYGIASANANIGTLDG